MKLQQKRKPSFLQHVKRAAWQSQVWMHSHIAEPNFQDSPAGNGWKITDDGHLEMKLFEGPSAAETEEFDV